MTLVEWLGPRNLRYSSSGRATLAIKKHLRLVRSSFVLCILRFLSLQTFKYLPNVIDTSLHTKPQKFDITADSKSPFSIQKQTIMMSGGGEVVNMTKSRMVNPETGE